MRQFYFTHHAEMRMYARRFSSDLVEKTLIYGRVVHTRGAKIFAVGNKEVNRYKNKGIDLRQCAGMQIVCSGNEIITVYRNHDFRGLKPTKKSRKEKRQIR